MKLLLFWTLVAVVLLPDSVLLAKDQPWTEVRSLHFRLITNGDPDEARHLLRQFELMRATFENAFPHFKLDGSAPLLILAPKDEPTTKNLLPQIWAHPGPKPGGLYRHGWEREYALVRLDAVGSDPETYRTVYHEYAHSLFHINFHWLPPWLDEGLGEFYGHTTFDDEKIYIGAPPIMAEVQFLISEPSIPLQEFISSPLVSSDPDKTRLSYAQAWALTHFLFFAPGMDNGQRLARFLGELQNGVEQKKAFLETIGNFTDVQSQYDKYIHQSRFSERAFPVPSQLNLKTFQTRDMSLGETEAELAAWYIRFHQWDKMREATETALANAPSLSLAHEDRGFLLFNEGHDGDALKEFTIATQLDDKNYIALFARTMVSPTSTSRAPQDEQKTYDGLNQVIALKPDFAPAYIELAKQAVREGQLDTALAVARRAEQLEPFRSGYHVFVGKILLLMNRPSDAAAQAAYVAQRWSGPDRSEAMELWNRMPPAERHVEAPTLPEPNDKWQTAEGKLQSVSCDGMAFSITLDVNGQAERFKTTGFPVGFSDTFWVGEDHFTPCFHVEGLRVIAHYKPAKDNTYSGDLVYAEFRDDLPEPPKLPPVPASTN
jgi:tetratricopeptide (TPR) repeat protein